MESRQLIAGGAYGPEALKVIGQAFDEAWRDIASNLGDPDIETARNRLARAILSIADDDSRDVSVLRQAALERMALDYKRRSPLARWQDVRLRARTADGAR